MTNDEHAKKLLGHRLKPTKWTAVDAARPAYHVPKDAFTIAEYCDRYKCHENTARRHIRALVAAGKLERGAGRRGRFNVTWYLATQTKGGDVR